MRRAANRISIPEINESINSIDKESDIHIGKSRELTRRINELLEIKQWNQKAFAENLGKSEAEISKLLSGVHNYTLRTIAKLEAVLEADIITIPKSNSFVEPMPVGEKHPYVSLTLAGVTTAVVVSMSHQFNKVSNAR